MMSELLGTEFTVTTTGPVMMLLGTVATICALLQLVTDKGNAPLKVTALVPCVVPKLVPLAVTTVPTGPAVGEILVTRGMSPEVNERLSIVAVVSAEL